MNQLEQELTIKGYSPRTIKAYMNSVNQFLIFVDGEVFGNDQGDNSEDLVKLFLYHQAKKGLAVRTRNQSLAALKFFYDKVIRLPDKIDISFARRPKRLPKILTNKQIKLMIERTDNRKHSLILALSYGAGLRVSEVRNLEVQDLNFERKTLHIRNAKGGKDRFTILPEKLLRKLELFIGSKEADKPLFESQRGGKLTTRSLQKVFKQALKRAGVESEHSFHSLRHSFATHLLDSGVNLRYIQTLLGHQNIRSTELYTQISPRSLYEINSPL